MKFKYIVEYENNSDKLDIGHCQTQGHGATKIFLQLQQLDAGRFLNNNKDIKTGKYKNMKIEEQICDYGNTGMVKDEIYFVCCCLLYESKREKLYTLVKSYNGTFEQLLLQDKLIYLLKNHLRNLCIFLSQAWDQITESLYKKCN